MAIWGRLDPIDSCDPTGVSSNRWAPSVDGQTTWLKIAMRRHCGFAGLLSLGSAVDFMSKK